MIEQALPTAEAIFASSSPWFSTIFDELFPFAYIAIGIAIASFLLWWIVQLFERGFDRLTMSREEKARHNEAEMWAKQELEDQKRYGGYRP